MPMQIGLDELLSMLMSRLDAATLESDNQRTRFNVLFRALYKKGLVSDDDVLEAVKDEHRIMKELGMIKELPPEAALKDAARSIMLWVKGDTEALKRSMREYEEQVKAAMEQEKKHIDVAPAGVLNELDRLGGAQGGGKRLIL